MSDTDPTILGDFTLRERLSRGHRSDVWLADAGELQAAVKVAHADSDHESILRERALLERSDHPNIIRVLQGDADGAWVAMEFFDGQRIDHWARESSLEDLFAAIGQLVDALAHLHQRNIVHADLKPRNVLVNAKGELKLIDLGIASLGDEDHKGFKGSLGFVAPEILRGAKPTAQTDVYGLGAVIYTALTGRPPFVAPDPAALTYLPLASLPPPITAFNPDVPSKVERIVLTLLARSPRRRPSKVDRIAEALKKAADSPILPPVAGMHHEREQLRRAVVGATDRECRIVVLYGPAGSGRRTLIDEALSYAKREGLRVIGHQSAAAVAKAIGTRGPPVAAAINGQGKGAQNLLSQIAKKGIAGLYLVRSLRPIPVIGKEGTQMSPPPLCKEDVEHILRYQELDLDGAADLVEQSMGMPGAVIGRIEGGSADSMGLSSFALRILAHLRDEGETDVLALATHLECGELALLDRCEVLFAGGLIVAVRDGVALRANA